MVMARIFGIASILAVTTLVGCSKSAEPTKATAAKTTDTSKKGKTDSKTASKKAPGSKPKIGDLAELGKSTTPPKGAKSVGEKDKPKAGGNTLPIEGVEVFAFDQDYDGDGDDDHLFWAHLEDGSTYIWAETEVECDDGESDGKAGFFMEIGPDGSGSWFFATDECPENNLYGCGFDQKGEETECGACAWDDEHIVCAEAEAEDDEDDEDED